MFAFLEVPRDHVNILSSSKCIVGCFRVGVIGVCSHVSAFPRLVRHAYSIVVLFCFGTVGSVGDVGMICIFSAVRLLCSEVLRVRQADAGGRVRLQEHTRF